MLDETKQTVEAREKVVDKIAKLLAMARDEKLDEKVAALYMDKAQALLALHNIEMSEIGGAKDPMIKDNDLLTDRAAWVKPLLHAVAKLYFCGYYFEVFPASWIKAHGFDKNNRKLKAGGHHRVFLRHSFIGQRVNIIVAKNMAEYLIDTMEKLCTEAEKSIRKEDKTSFRYSFMNACASRLCFRMEQRRRDTSVVGDVKSNLPALRNVYDAAQEDVKSWLDANDTKLREKKSLMKVKNAAGAFAGMKAGDNIGLDDQLADRSISARITHAA